MSFCEYQQIQTSVAHDVDNGVDLTRLQESSYIPSSKPEGSVSASGLLCSVESGGGVGVGLICGEVVGAPLCCGGCCSSVENGWEGLTEPGSSCTCWELSSDASLGLWCWFEAVLLWSSEWCVYRVIVLASCLASEDRLLWSGVE